MKFTFFQPKELDTLEFQRLIDKFKEDLKELCSGNVDKDGAFEYVTMLLKEARTFECAPQGLFWGFEDPKYMPKDAVIDFIYTPTYVATAFLIKFYMLCEEKWHIQFEKEFSKHNISLKFFRESFYQALWACASTKFAGHGYDAISDKLEALEIFIKADTATFVRRYCGLCQEFDDIFKKEVLNISIKACEGKLIDSWGEDYSERARELLGGCYKILLG